MRVVKISKWLVVIALVMSSFAAQAVGSVYQSGTIVTISAKTVSFDDEFFMMSPTVKVWTVLKKKTSWLKLKVGDYVELQITTIAKKSMVDNIYILPANQREQNEQ